MSILLPSIIQEATLLPKKRKPKFSTHNLKDLYEKYEVEISQPQQPAVPRSSPSSSNEKQLDCHEMSLWEVKQWLFGDMVGYSKVGFSEFQIIHGFNHGTVIRTYIRTHFHREFIQKFRQVTISIQPKDKGTTIIVID